MKTMQIALPPDQVERVDRLVKSGRFGDASEYVADLVRRDEQKERATQRLVELAEEGLNSGPGIPMSPKELGQYMQKRIDAVVALGREEVEA